MGGRAGRPGRGVPGGLLVQPGGVSFLSGLPFSPSDGMGMSRLRRLAGDVSVIAWECGGGMAIQSVGGVAGAGDGMDCGAGVDWRDDGKNFAGRIHTAGVYLVVGSDIGVVWNFAECLVIGKKEFCGDV